MISASPQLLSQELAESHKDLYSKMIVVKTFGFFVFFYIIIQIFKSPEYVSLQV